MVTSGTVHAADTHWRVGFSLLTAERVSDSYTGCVPQAGL